MFIKKLQKDIRGTALLVALLVMGVLIAVSLALSGLIIRELRVTKDLIDSGRAYYAAESGIEVALYNLNNRLPGWEPDLNDYENEFKFLKISDEYSAVGEYKMNNRCNAYPCFDEDEYDLDEDRLQEPVPLQAFYDVLDLNEAITIPLFVVDEDGNEKKVNDFTVEFYGNFNLDDLKVSDKFNLSGWDVLRWKIFGISETNEGTFTDSISDFTALSTASMPGSNEQIETVASIPSWFGTIGCNDQENLPRYTDRIKCAQYAVKNTYTLQEGSQRIFGGICFNTEAREYYDYGDDRDLSSDEIRHCYPIEEFLEEHKYNYLSLTNLMNPAVFEETDDQLKREKSKIYFRVELYSDETVREFADIAANGYSGDTKQSINVKIKRGSFMPVFNFSLYSTYTGEKGYSHYYGETEEEELIF